MSSSVRCRRFRHSAPHMGPGSALPPRVSAGVVCLTLIDGRVHIILGQEAPVPNWNGSHRWSDFGGRAKATDAGWADTAAREFAEESLGVLGHVGPQLDNGRYLLRLQLHRPNPRRASSRILYVLEVPYDPTARQRFHALRDTLLSINDAAAAAQAEAAVLSRERHPTPGRLLRLNTGLYIVDDVVAVAMPTAETCHVMLGVRRGTQVKYPVSSPDVAARYVRLLAHRNRAFTLAQTLPRWLFDKVRPAATAWLPNVHADLLEKTDMDAWSLTDLNACVSRNNNIMRGSFMVPLKIILQSLALSGDGQWR